MNQGPDRLDHLCTFYSLLTRLEERTGGMRRLSTCTGRMPWPARGVYFFFEEGEVRRDSGTGPRVVRVGTHGLTAGSSTTLWTRLSQHRGALRSGGGNHRGSIFRLIIGETLAQGDERVPESWGRGSSADRQTRAGELRHERRVSAYLGSMKLLWLKVSDGPGAQSLRGLVERNAIGLLSNFGRPAIDPPSRNWLGHVSLRDRVRESGLWNQNHVDEDHDPDFLRTLEDLVSNMRGPA